MLFAVWQGSPHRPTQDLDLLGFGDPSLDRITGVFRDLCQLQAEPDGWIFDPKSVAAETIRTIDNYGGVRVNLTGRIGSGVVRVQIDIGFGDAITPAAVNTDYPVLLKQPVPHLRTYPAVSVVAEKTEAIVKLGMLNTRFKDYYDIAFLASHFTFEGPELVRALQATFQRRATTLPVGLPAGLTEAFAQDLIKQRQWAAFTRRIAIPDITLAAVVAQITAFIQLPLESAQRNAAFNFHWQLNGPWENS